MQIYEWNTEIDSVPTSTPTPTPGPGMRFTDIEPFKVKEIESPLEPSTRIMLVKKNWIFINNGAVEENMRIDVDELNSAGSIIKTLSSRTIYSVSPGLEYRVAINIQNDVDFSQRYETGNKLHLAISIWGETTESKPFPPFTNSIAKHSDVSIWSVDIVPEISPPSPVADMRFHEDIKDHVVRKLVGPLKPTDRPVLVTKLWHLMNKGLTSDYVRVDIDEIDADGNLIKLIGDFHTTVEIDAGETRRIDGDLTNWYDFSRRYEIGETLYLCITTWADFFEHKPQRSADVHFEDDILYHEVKDILGPLETTDRITLLNKGWHFLFNGGNPEIVKIDIDEIDIESNFIKTISSYETTAPVSFGKHELHEDIPNTVDFSQRYETGDTLFLGASIWGRDTETKLDMPPASLINVIRWSYKVILPIP